MELFEKIKCVLRANPFYKRHCQTHVNNCRYWVRNMKYYRSYFWRKDKEVNGHTIYFIIDPQITHPGLADRFKAIIGTYYIAKQNNFDFKIIFTYPFTLSDYLGYASQNWIASFDDLSYSFQNSRIIAYNGGGKVPILNKSIKQYHVYCYIGYDILETNQIGDYKAIWGKLYRELFQPTPLLEKALLNYAYLKENQFIAIHLRFVNALEHFEGNQFNFLTPEQKEHLITRCISAIQDIINRNPEKQIVVFSDSNIFLTRIKKELPIHVLEGKIGHISFSGNEDIIVKTFIDFYMISKASHVIRILAPEMYGTVFSYYAALIGNKTCIDYKV